MTEAELLEAIAHMLERYEADSGTIVGCYMSFERRDSYSSLMEWTGETFCERPTLQVELVEKNDG